MRITLLLVVAVCVCVRLCTRFTHRYGERLTLSWFLWQMIHICSQNDSLPLSFFHSISFLFTLFFYWYNIIFFCYFFIIIRCVCLSFGICVCACIWSHYKPVIASIHHFSSTHSMKFIHTLCMWTLKTKQNKTCAIFCSVCECVCVCSSSISLDSDDDTVWHLRRSPCDLNIQSHILFCTVRLFSFPFSQCDCSNASERYISYFKLKHTAVCASMCCSIIAWVSTVCSAQKQILGTLYSTQHSLSLSHSLAVYCTVCIHHTHVWNMQWALAESVSYLCAVSVSLSLSLAFNPSPCQCIVQCTIHSECIHTHKYHNTYIQFSK